MKFDIFSHPGKQWLLNGDNRGNWSQEELSKTFYTEKHLLDPTQ